MSLILRLMNFMIATNQVDCNSVAVLYSNREGKDSDTNNREPNVFENEKPVPKTSCRSKKKKAKPDNNLEIGNDVISIDGKWNK